MFTHGIARYHNAAAESDEGTLHFTRSIVPFQYLFRPLQRSEVCLQNGGTQLADHNFYILVFLQCSSHIIAISILAIEPDRNPSFYDVDFVKGTGKSIEALNYAMEMLGSCGMLVLGWLVVVTMYQLTLSLRVIF